MTTRKPPKKTQKATTERMAPVLAKVRDKIAEDKAAIDQDKAAKPHAAPASAPTVNTVEEQSAEPRFLKLPGTPAARPPAAPSTGALRIASAPGETSEEVSARVALHPAIQNAFIAKVFTEGKAPDQQGSKITGPLDMTACGEAMIQKIEALERNGTQELEQMLLCQANACQAIFYEMARRAALNMGTYIQPTEVYMRLALKAQSQCRATIETLAEIKNPRPVYLNPRQVNNVAGNQQLNSAKGPQQVNNGCGSETARAEENKKPENKLLETA